MTIVKARTIKDKKVKMVEGTLVKDNKKTILMKLIEAIDISSDPAVPVIVQKEGKVIKRHKRKHHVEVV